MAVRSQDNDDERRARILEAALACFLQFGFAKTSMQDISAKAQVSRPLLYLRFKNKKDLLAGLLDHLLAGCYESAERCAHGKGSAADRLRGVCDALLLTPWGRISGAPMVADFYAMCSENFPAFDKKYKQRFIRSAQVVLSNKHDSEVFFLAATGLQEGVPSTQVLRRRVYTLVQKFAAHL